LLGRGDLFDPHRRHRDFVRGEELQQEQQDEALASARKEQVKSGGRSEKIRTYNYKVNRVTDHRIGLTVYALDRVLDGDLDEFIDKLAADERQRQLGGE